MDQLVANNSYQSGADSFGAVTNIYECWSAFSINSSNQLEGTLWLEKNGQRVTTGVSNGSYQFYDKTGAAVSGLSQTSLAADGNGLFHITATSAANILPLNHYVIKISMIYDGSTKESYRGLLKEG